MNASPKEMVGEFRSLVHELFPPDFRQHMFAMRKEFYLAMRSLIDARIDSMERKEKLSAKKATRVNVE
ncbi:MAG: hypothetical protein M1343_12095 [Chloroflexi bacterium]|nr:hypothetical protein [Chloroflexota bacterium]MDA8187027.1 hypothetical protein [Dehalococcoidales bacterium]